MKDEDAAFYIPISIQIAAEPVCLSWEIPALLCWMLLQEQFLLRGNFELSTQKKKQTQKTSKVWVVLSRESEIQQ